MRMFVELLFNLRTVLSLLREIRAEQRKQREELAAHRQEFAKFREMAEERFSQEATILQRLFEVLQEVVDAVTLPAAEVLILTGEVEGIPQGENTMRMFESQQGSFTLAAKTKTGNPAKVDGVPVWTVQAGMESAVALEVAADGMSAVVKAQPFAADDPNVKSLSVLVTADADLGEGVKPLEASASIELVRDEATVLELTEGPVTDQ